MAITNATRLSDFAAGIGTEGAILKIDNANQRVGIGTQLPSQMLEVAGIVSATQYIGDGSLLEGITSAGLGTAIDDTDGSVGAVVYYTDDLLNVTETTTINPPASASAAYTQYRDVKLETNVDLIIETGDDFIPDVLGLGTGSSDPNAAGNGVFDEVYAGVIKNKDGLGAPSFANGLTSVGIATFSNDVSIGGTLSVTGNVSVGGTLTYEDVKNVDSVGLITARTGIKVTAGGIDVTAGTINASGDGVNAASNLILKTAGSEKVRIASDGNVSIGGMGQNSFSNYRTLTIGGAGASDGSGIDLEKSDGTIYGRIFADTNGLQIASPASGDYIRFETQASERLRIGSAGQLGIAGANYGTSGQVLTSGGGSAAVQWATPSGGAWEVLTSEDITTSYGQTYWESKSWDVTNYTAYRYIFNQVAVAGGNFDLHIRFYYQPYNNGSASGAESLETGNNYAYRYDRRRLNASGSSDNDLNESQWRLGGTYSAETWNVDHTVSLSPPTYMNIKSVSGRTFYYNSGALWRVEDDCCMFWHQTGYISGVRVYGSGGNLQHGRFQVLRMSRT